MPHRNIPLREERLVIGRLWLDLFHNGYSWGPPKNPGTKARQTLVYVALYIGTAEGKPMTVATCASYTGLPYNTCERRIEELCELGIAKRQRGGKTFTLDLGHLAKPEEQEKVLRACHMILQAAEKLSKLENVTIVR